MACATCETNKEKLVNLLPGIRICKDTTACNQRRKKLENTWYGDDENTTVLKNYDIYDPEEGDDNGS